MSWLSITLDGGRTAYEPGERVRGTVSWMVEGKPERVAAHLLWYTEGKGTQDIGIAATAELPVMTEGSAEIDLELPEGPWSFSGSFVSLLWAVELAVEPGIGATREAIVVAPGGEEVRIAGGEPSPEAAQAEAGEADAGP